MSYAKSTVIQADDLEAIKLGVAPHIFAVVQVLLIKASIAINALTVEDV